MKRLLFIIFAFFSLASCAQFPNNASIGTVNSGVLVRGRLSADSLLQINTTCFADTTAANRGRIKEVPGAIIRLCNNTIKIRNNTATAWIALGGGTGSISSVTFNTDSSVIICYGSGVCDTISMTNSTFVTNTQLTNSPYFVFDSTCNCWVVDSSRVSTVRYTDSSVTNNVSGGCNSIVPNGNIVTWSGTGLKFYVTGGDFYIGCRKYTAVADSFTLSAADPSNPRFDVPYRDTLGNIGVLQGDPASPPLIRQANSSYQVALTAILVLAGATTPAVVDTCDNVYNENVQVAGGEWNSLATNVSVNPNQSGVASSGSKSTYFNNIEGQGVSYYVTNNRGVDSDAVLKFKILFTTFGKQLASNTPTIYLGVAKDIFVTPYNPSVYSTYIQHGQNGFDSTNKTTWQPISIPLSQFKLNGWGNSPDSINLISITASADTAGGAPGAKWYIDEVTVQCGLNQGGVETNGSVKFSSGDLSPLFTTSVSNPTTNPLLSFSAISQSPYTVYGRGSGSGIPSFNSLDTNYIAGFSTYVRPLISLTTTGTSGAATYDNTTGIFNIPQYSGGFTTADNGLTASSATNVQLGGLLLQNTTIATGAFGLTVSTSTASQVPLVVTSTSGNSINATATSGIGVNGESSSSIGVKGTSSSSYGVNAVSTTGRAIIGSVIGGSNNSVNPMMELLKQTFGTAASGIGGSVDIIVSTDGGNRTSNQLISKWTTAADATRTSQFIITGVLSGTTGNKAIFNGDGSWQIVPITATAASAITPAEGMILFTSDTNATFTSVGFWGYQGGVWVKM